MLVIFIYYIIFYGGIVIKKYLEIGKIVSTHGIKGEVKVHPWCDSPDFFFEFDNFYFKNGEEEIDVDTLRIQKNMIVMKINNVDTPEEAVKFRNKVVFIDRDDIELEDDCFFVQDLIGMKVVDADSEKLYGEIIDVTETGANDVYHIKFENGKTYYIPAIADVVINTDISANTMTIRPLKGLFDDED